MSGLKWTDGAHASFSFRCLLGVHRWVALVAGNGRREAGQLEAGFEERCGRCGRLR
jgi:hypothetical protein